MRIKFLSVIAGFFITSVVTTSCLDNESEISYSPDATIHAFELDPVYRVNYKFTIDQLKGEIYNVDSMPMHADTIIDRILIKKLATASNIVTIKSHDGKRDSLLNINDSLDFRKTMKDPMKITVWAPDMQNKKEYKISVRIHLQDPDSLNWGKGPMAASPVTGKQKMVILKDQILLFSESNETIYTSTISDGHTWNNLAITGMPENFKLSSLTSFDQRLYVVTQDGKVYKSNEEGTAWSEDTGLSQQKVIHLIAAFPTQYNGVSHESAGLVGIVENSGTLKFNKTNASGSQWDENLGSEVDPYFPVDFFSSASYLTKTERLNVALVGKTKEGLENDTTTIVWTSENGKSWYPMTIDSKMFCPKLEQPSIMSYNNAFYILGKGFKTFYRSSTLLEWKEVTEKFRFPEWNVASKNTTAADYAMTIDKDHFIWITSGAPIGSVWRGRLNKLGFLRQ